MLKRIIATLIAAASLMTTVACTQIVEDNPSETTASEVTEATTAATEATTEATTVTTEATTVTTAEPEPDIRTVSLLCAGDNLIHSSIYNQAKRRAKANGDEDGYDFDYVYESIESYFEGVDIAILNQETIVTDELEPSDYPNFCSPGDLGRKMVDLGFNVISISNNHVLDRGETGLLATLNFWKEQEDVVVYGAYESEEDMNNIRTMEVNGITFAFLGYTQHTNGLYLPSDTECWIIRITDDNMELIEEQVRYADSIADVVVVSVHYGTEVSNELSSLQISLTPQLVEWGADLIIGTQAHTVETMEYIDKPDGGQAFVFYGLGNLVSAMADPLAMVGIIGKLEITKNMDTGEVTIENVKAIPIITQYGYNYSNIHIEPYATYTDELLSAHGCSGFTQDTIDKVLSYIPEEFLSIE
ncbi:MAG: CapA family protein [Oscillospiraceae bacterium]|nr:CapA family protein [Oscillospiraceae bacterium]